MQAKQLPKTLALIPDGNRRWARSHRLSVLSGYDRGVKKFISFSEWCTQYGINSIAVWALSTENLKRDRKETETLFRIYVKAATDNTILQRLHKNRTRLRVVGDRKLLPKELRAALENLESETRRHKANVINMLIGYGGHDDIMHAVKGAIKKVKNAALMSDALFEGYLLSKAIPKIDFVIRTSGEQRLSGFMPWQTEYSELYFSKKLWPDFTKDDLHKALLDYSKRKRRFGK